MILLYLPLEKHHVKYLKLANPEMKATEEIFLLLEEGHTSQIACGISMSINKRVWCFDGDGAALMHLGAAGISAIHAKSNFIHILLNNVAHDSVGGQPTIADQIDFLIYLRI